MSASVVSNEPATTKRLGGVTGKGFMPGQSGNPTGRRPGVASQARALIKDDPSGLLKVFLSIARNTKAKPADRLAAAREFLDRAYGKAPEHAPVEGGDPLELDSIERAIAEVVDELAARREAQAPGATPGAAVAPASSA